MKAHIWVLWLSVEKLLAIQLAFDHVTLITSVLWANIISTFDQALRAYKLKLC